MELLLSTLFFGVKPYFVTSIELYLQLRIEKKLKKNVNEARRQFIIDKFYEFNEDLGESLGSNTLLARSSMTISSG